MRMWSSIEPPTSRNSSSFTLLCRSGTILRSSQPALCAVERTVSGRSSSNSAPSRANWRNRRNASLMLRVPSSTVSSRLRNSRLSQILTALILDQRGARQEIEVVDVEQRDPLAHPFQEGQELAQRGRHLGRPQFEEEGDEHTRLDLMHSKA